MFSKHAREQIVARDISVNEVEEAINRGSKELQGTNKILHHYRHFTVVSRKINEIYFIITVKPRW